jgi:methyl-accepting chemotaxis protein/methyl-accepting chemotaxis protein-1 (serine sensor receptor)
VASEVRNLAQRSANAAKEIKQLIGDSVDKVDSGARLVDEAGATMKEIVTSIQRVTDIMGDITQASLEQTAGLDQIHKAIDEMDAITQQNVALVEEATAAANALHDQADALVQVVSVFHLDGMPGQKPVRPAPAARPGNGAATPAPALSAPAPRATPAARQKAAAAHEEWETF